MLLVAKGCAVLRLFSCPGLGHRSWQFLTVMSVGFCLQFMAWSVSGQDITNHKYGQEDKFRQLEESWPTPNGYRNAAGEPGPDYWQQSVDYVIDVELDDKARTITGKEQITYHNNSPQPLRYLWLQLDANIYKPDSDAALTGHKPIGAQLSLDELHNMQAAKEFDGGVNITSVTDAQGQPLRHTIVKTMMRVDLPSSARGTSIAAFQCGLEL